MILQYKVIDENKYANVKEVLKAEFLMSDRLLLKLKKMQKITLNGESVYVHHTIKAGDIIKCDLNYEEDNSNIVPNNMKLDIIYEDEAYLIVNKPAGVPIHPSMEHYTDSLSNAARTHFDEIKLHKKIRPVNRLDKDTSGLVVFAKNEYVQECLIKQMQNKSFKKKYIALVNGHLGQKEGTICAPISRKPNSIIERCVNENGDVAITHFKVLTKNDLLNIFNINFTNFESNDNCNYEPNVNTNSDFNIKNNIKYEIVECTLETGRTHQIRVHFAYIGHPLLGDTLYGSPSQIISRQALHAYQISFVHPITKQKVTYTADLPEDIKACIS